MMAAHDLKVGLKIVPLGWHELIPALLAGKSRCANVRDDYYS